MDRSKESDFAQMEDQACAHGGAFFEAIGETFQCLERSAEIVNADVLDAWFPPAPGVIEAVQRYLPWLLRTSPPTRCQGFIETIAEARGVSEDSLVVGAGSSNLIFLALREWLTPNSRVLLPDPTYGEYAHVLERVIGCSPERYALAPSDDFRINLDDLLRRLQQNRYDLAILVNPNNPTGQFIPRPHMESFLTQIPAHTRLWIDEAYIDYCGSAHSVEREAAASPNIFVCKSLSKAYALSGARAAYLCGPPAHIQRLRLLTPPWAIGLPTQVAAVTALRESAYYEERYVETTALRHTLASALRASIPALHVVEGAANFLLCYLPPEMPPAAQIIEGCRKEGVFLRDAGSMSRLLGERCLRIAVKDAASSLRIVDAVGLSVNDR